MSNRGSRFHVKYGEARLRRAKFISGNTEHLGWVGSIFLCWLMETFGVRISFSERMKTGQLFGLKRRDGDHEEREF